MARPMTTFIRKLVDFGTSKASYFFGILPSFTTLLALIIVGIAVAGATTLLASTASILPALVVTMGAALVNYWFSREIQSVMLGITPSSTYVISDGKEIEQDWTYDIGIKKGHDKKVRYNLSKSVDHLRGVINAHYSNDAPLPPIRLGTFAEHHYKFVVTGRNPGKSMIAFANPGVFHTFKGKPRELNALILQALAQIKLRSTFSGMMVAVLMDFGLLLQSFKENDSLVYKAIGYMVAPFGQLLTNAMSRTNVYYRADRIVAECGYGEDLIKALDLLNQPNNIAKVNTHRSAPTALPEPRGWTAPFVRWARKMNDIIRSDSHPGEDETGYIFLQLLDNLVLRFGSFFKELFSAAPRMGHRKDAIKEYITAYEQEHGHKPAMQQPCAHANYKYCDVETLNTKFKKYAKAQAHAHAHAAGENEHAEAAPEAAPAPSEPVLPPQSPATPVILSQAPAANSTPVVQEQPSLSVPQAAEPVVLQLRRSPRLNPVEPSSPLRRSPRLSRSPSR